MESNTLFSDFSIELSNALKQGFLFKNEFISKKYKGDPTLEYSVSDEAIKLSSKVVSDLEYISKYSLSLKTDYCLAMEIAFSALIDETSLKITRIFMGEVGDCGECDIDAGDLLTKSFAEATKTNTKVSLCHTHPVFSSEGNTIDPELMYGAIPSCIAYGSAKQVKDSFKKNEKLADEIIRTKIYKHHRGDYVELFMRAQLEPMISKYAIIMSPALKKLGIFEVNQGGNIVYHPWVIVEEKLDK